MATRKVNLMFDEDLIARARQQDLGESSKTDVEVVEDALSVFLGLRALDESRAQGTQPGLIRAVVDPSVFVSAFIGNPDAGPGRLVAAWRDRRFVLVVSPRLLEELGDVLSRPRFARWASDGRAEAYVAALAARSEHHPDRDQPPSVVRDPEDDYLIALMHTAQADLLVSLDNDLLDAELDDITVLDPAVFLTRVDQSESEAGKAEHFFTGETQAGRE